MTIRSEQLGAFEEAALCSFESRMLAHVKEFFPELVAERGDDDTREVIREAVCSAEEAGITTEQDVGQYILLMFLHGLDDSDAETAWMIDLLRQQDLAVRERLELLWHWTNYDLAGWEG